MHLRVVLLGLGCSLIIAALPPPVAAKTLIFQETFEEVNALSNWTEVRNQQYAKPELVCMNQQQPAVWQVVGGAAEIVIDSNPCTMELVANDQVFSTLDSYEFLIDVTLLESTNMDRNILFLWVDQHNWYDIKLLENEIRVQKVVDGISYQLPNSVGHFVFTSDKTYQFQVRFDQSTIDIAIDQQPVLSISEALPLIAHQQFSVGLQAGVGALRKTHSRFDNLTVYRLDDLGETRVPLLKQTDPLWSETEYDQASLWTEQVGIGRWGCALTSLAMIMQYHGLTQLPGGAALTPAALNDWLKSQPDGYVGEGLLNFAAAMRLTKQLSDTYGTPALEYRRIPWTGATTLGEIQSQLQQQPVIIQIPGHFVVGTKVIDDQADIAIHDPAYEYSRLSQHTTTPLSYRTLTPSYTDLSYLVLVGPPQVQVLIRAPDNTTTVPVEDWILGYDQSTMQTETNHFQILEIAQPIAGTYSIEVLNQDINPLPLSLFSYTDDGKVTTLQIVAEPGVNQPQLYQLDFAIDRPAILKQVGSWQTFQSLLDNYHLSKDIAQPSAWWWLDQLSQIPQSAQSSSGYYKTVVQSLLNWYQPSISQTAVSHLFDELAIIPE